MERKFDIVIIGGGVVGLGIFQRLSYDYSNLKICLVESENELMTGASSGNSGVFHTGFDAPSHSLELLCMKRGWKLMKDLADRTDIPLVNCGAILVAWTEEQYQSLPDILAKSKKNGISNVFLLSRDEVLEFEPHLNPSLLGGIFVPQEKITDPWLVPIFFAFDGISRGNVILTGNKIINGNFSNKEWTLYFKNQNPIITKFVINCGGNFGDEIERIRSQECDFEIRPRKGQFVVFGPQVSNLISSTILPVPTQKTKGVLIFKTIYGNLVVGPTAEDQMERREAKTSPEGLSFLLQKAHSLLPELKHHQPIGSYAGIRPATQFNEYQIHFFSRQNWTSVNGIRSTGLTASLGIADYVSRQMEMNFVELERKKEKEDSVKQRKIVKKMKEQIYEKKQPFVEFEGRKFHVTHHLTQFSLLNPISKL